jgi:hypothetical protein
MVRLRARRPGLIGDRVRPAAIRDHRHDDDRRLRHDNWRGHDDRLGHKDRAKRQGTPRLRRLDPTAGQHKEQ